MTPPSAPSAAARVAVYPGSFDPMTNGHLEIARRAARLFDRVIVAVGRHPTKRGTFEPAQRVALVEQALAAEPTIEVRSFNGLVVDFCVEVGASVIVRGLRASGDFESEFQMGLANRALAPQIETAFLIPSPEHMFVSSSLIREIAGYRGAFEQHVPPCVAVALHARYDATGSGGDQA